jgi:ubiquinone/menaquinone biosynthesis C-methylase UbiE
MQFFFKDVKMRIQGLEMCGDEYSFSAKYYDIIIGPLIKGLRRLGVDMYAPKRGMSILDVGCGTGELLKLYKRYPTNLFGIDASPAMLAAARQKLGEGVDLHLGDAKHMPFEDEFFDLITAMFVMHEMDHISRISTLMEIKRILKKEGRILLIDYHTGPVRELKGRITKMAVHFIEGFAGKRHFNNFLQFHSLGGLQALVSHHDLFIDKKKIVGGGNMALFLLKKSNC